jgi:hypothetical protein
MRLRSDRLSGPGYSGVEIAADADGIAVIAGEFVVVWLQ